MKRREAELRKHDPALDPNLPFARPGSTFLAAASASRSGRGCSIGVMPVPGREGAVPALFHTRGRPLSTPSSQGSMRDRRFHRERIVFFIKSMAGQKLDERRGLSLSGNSAKDSLEIGSKAHQKRRPNGHRPSQWKCEQAGRAN
jgi:hypothetical protein